MVPLSGRPSGSANRKQGFRGCPRWSIAVCWRVASLELANRELRCRHRQSAVLQDWPQRSSRLGGFQRRAWPAEHLRSVHGRGRGVVASVGGVRPNRAAQLCFRALFPAIPLRLLRPHRTNGHPRVRLSAKRIQSRRRVAGERHSRWVPARRLASRRPARRGGDLFQPGRCGHRQPEAPPNASGYRAQSERPAPSAAGATVGRRRCGAGAGGWLALHLGGPRAGHLHWAGGPVPRHVGGLRQRRRAGYPCAAAG